MRIGYLSPIHIGKFPKKYREYDPFMGLREEIDALFDNKDLVGLEGLRMHVDISENDQNIVVTAELPGVEEKDIAVSVSDNILTVEGEKKTERDEKKEKYHLTERSYGTFKRSIQLPFTPDPKKVQATFKNGILTVEVEKSAKEIEKSHTIPVKAS